MNGEKEVTNDLFEEELKQAAGMTLAEFNELTSTKDEGIEFPEEPFVV